MKKSILFYFIFYMYNCATPVKQDGQSSCTEVKAVSTDKRLIKTVKCPEPKQGFNVLADSIFAISYPLYDSVSKNTTGGGYYYLDIHLYIGDKGELKYFDLDCSKLFEGYFENQKMRINLNVGYWQPAVNKESQKLVNYSVNILSKIYENKHEIVFFNIQNDTLAKFIRSR